TPFSLDSAVRPLSAVHSIPQTRASERTAARFIEPTIIRPCRKRKGRRGDLGTATGARAFAPSGLDPASQHVRIRKGPTMKRTVSRLSLLLRTTDGSRSGALTDKIGFAGVPARIYDELDAPLVLFTNGND